MKARSEAGVTTNVAPALDGPIVATSGSDVLAETASVDAVNVALVAPAAIETVDGYEMLESPPLSVTVTPVGPAAPVSFIVPTAFTPPTTVAGAKLRLDTTPAGLTSRVDALVTPFKFALIGSFTFRDTVDVDTAKVAEVAPLAIVTVDG